MKVDQSNNAVDETSRRTMAKGVGCFVDDMHLHATDKRLSAIERQDIVEDALRFEECSYSEQDLNAMTDATLIAAHFRVTAEYAIGV